MSSITTPAGGDPEIVVEGLETRRLGIADLILFRAEAHRDARGSVRRAYSQPFLDAGGIDFHLVHENHCWSPRAGTVRGFHYQLPPYGQPKLIEVTRGRILDVNVDLRKSSPTFGQHAAVEIDAAGWNQILVPEGFAHCYLTLEQDTEVTFKLGCGYAPRFARGLAWNDPDLAIHWPVRTEDAIVIARDLDRPRFSSLSSDELFP